MWQLKVLNTESEYMTGIYDLLNCFNFQYKYCGEGCCPHEFCAYHKICYPVIHCDPTCPDGSCLNGLCFPAKPCKQNTECGFAETCTYHYNLGYDTCQYNLNIGDTLCYDRQGNAVYNPKPDESPFEHDIFKNKQNNLWHGEGLIPHFFSNVMSLPFFILVFTYYFFSSLISWQAIP